MEEFFQVFKAKVERCLELWGLQPWTVTESLLKPKGLVTEWTQAGLSSSVSSQGFALEHRHGFY